jgi:hypothetical protein
MNWPLYLREENKDSLQREKIFQSEIKSLQDDMKVDSHRSDLREQINILRREIEEEKDARQEWSPRFQSPTIT